MLTVACIKQVPDTTQVRIDPETNALIREGIPFIINPYDLHALEESLRFQERFGLRSVALSMGPLNAEAALRRALALLEQSLPLLGQNTDPEISEQTVYGKMAEVYQGLDEVEKGIELSKKHNAGGLNNS
ncbi:MAG: electron transfer flavoprotein subunit beta, partial [Deltaproteobacteria bacterium]|nr:electron transfer flavoprotein subunit beta [Deltaproteobacteria bacterium]